MDGHEIRGVTRKSLRKSYAMVLQDTWLFHGSIYENLAYGKEGATMDEVMAAAKAARIHSFIKRLPDGYETILTDDGTNISKGQKQLLTIARAMLLDAMRKLMEGKTCFVIAHRLSTIRNADLILVIKQGEVVEKGNHEELMRAEGEYYQMYTAQGE